MQTKPRFTAHQGYLAFCAECDRFTEDVHGYGWNGLPEQDFGYLCPVCIGKRMDAADAAARFPLLSKPRAWLGVVLALCVVAWRYR